MRIHYLQHVPFEGLGFIGQWAEAKRHTVSETKPFRGDSMPDRADFDMLVVMGGPMGVYDTVAFPWLKEEKGFIEQAIREGKKVLGICLGAQLIADVLGAKVYKNPMKEIGWFPVTRVQGTETLAHIGFFPERFHAFHWHGDTFDLPSGAIHLARSQACAHQAFFYPPGVLGLQFHLETTLESIDLLIENCADELVAGPWIQGAEMMRSQSHLIGPSNEQMHRILDTFLEGAPS